MTPRGPQNIPNTFWRCPQYVKKILEDNMEVSQTMSHSCIQDVPNTHRGRILEFWEPGSQNSCSLDVWKTTSTPGKLIISGSDPCNWCHDTASIGHLKAHRKCQNNVATMILVITKWRTTLECIPQYYYLSVLVIYPNMAPTHSGFWISITDQSNFTSSRPKLYYQPYW